MLPPLKTLLRVLNQLAFYNILSALGYKGRSLQSTVIAFDSQLSLFLEKFLFVCRGAKELKPKDQATHFGVWRAVE
ncbi:hypothetical protein [Bartonella apihabitans]|uniref:hypothetical protein n=1 Tax=Bartonella apihabitans TaxID=2750929 RepID=UPI00098EC66B|nr:hypothetical protein [Bartonella apihabitans]